MCVTVLVHKSITDTSLFTAATAHNGFAAIAYFNFIIPWRREVMHADAEAGSDRCGMVNDQSKRDEECWNRAESIDLK